MRPELRLKTLDNAISEGKFPSWLNFARNFTINGDRVWKSQRTFEDDVKRLREHLQHRFPNIPEKHLVFNKVKSGYQYHPEVSGLADLSASELERIAALGKDLLDTGKNLIISDTARNLLERLSTIARVHDFEKQRTETRWSPVEFLHEGRRQGQAFVDPLIAAITELQPVTFVYCPYQKTPKAYTVLPLLIKEWDNAWYLLVRRLNGDETTLQLRIKDLQLFALDRIQHIDVHHSSLKNKIKNLSSFQPSLYFKHVYGIWSSNLNEDPSASKIHRIVLETRDSWHYGYLKNNPIHATKTVMINDPEAHHLRIQIECQLNPDLISFLLRFFPEIKVLSPKPVIKALKRRIELAAQSIRD